MGSEKKREDKEVNRAIGKRRKKKTEKITFMKTKRGESFKK